MSTKACGSLCKKKSYKVAAIKAGLKCFCGNKVHASDQVSINRCMQEYHDSFIVYDAQSSVNYKDANKWYHFCKNDPEEADKEYCKSGKCSGAWGETFCRVSYIGCYQFIEKVKTKDVGSVLECLIFCRQEKTNFLALKGGKECSCNDRLGSAVPSSYCNTSCPNNEACGGNIYYSIYKNGYRTKHDVFVSYRAGSTTIQHDLEFHVPYTLEMCAHFCLEMSLTYFMMKDAITCSCAQNAAIIQPSLSHSNIPCRPCKNDEDEICKCYSDSYSTDDVLSGTRFTYDFQRGLSSLSHCPITGKLKLMHTCTSGCYAGWKGYACRERDCTVRNGDCGAEMKCVESLVNNTMYTECACPTGTVRNNFNLCEVFRENLALHKPAFLSSVNGANEAKYLTDGIYYDFKFAQINDKKSNWMAVDLQMSYCIGFVIVYNRFSETDSIMHQLDNFVVRLNGTFDTSADYDIRKKVNLCGRWPSEALNGVNPMKVVCENFTLISKFVIVQEADKNFIGSMGVVELEVYSVGCDVNNGNCGNLHCDEVLHGGVTVIKCETLSDDIVISSPGLNRDSIYGCFKRVSHEYLHDHYALTKAGCANICKSKSYGLSAMKAGIKCFCANKFVVNDQFSIDYCVREWYDTYIVYDVESSVDYNDASKWYRFCKNNQSESDAETCKSGECSSGWVGSLCNMQPKVNLPFVPTLEDQITYTIQGSDNRNKIVHIREGQNLRLTCFTNEYSTVKDFYWTYVNGDPVMNYSIGKAKVTLNKQRTVLSFENAISNMSNNYYCSDTAYLRHHRIQYKVSVFSIAQMEHVIFFNFSVASCSEKKFNLAEKIIKDDVCRLFKSNCPYKFQQECVGDRIEKRNIFNNSKKMIDASISATNVVKPYFEKLCGTNCSLYKMLQILEAKKLTPSKTLGEVLKAKFNSHPVIYLSKFDATTELIPTFRCSPGFFLNFEMFCTPCEAGYYSEDNQSKECLPCPNNTYQDEFGSTSCKKCPEKSGVPGNSSNCFNEEVVLKSWNIKDEQFGDELFIYYLLMSATCCFIILTVFAMCFFMLFLGWFM